LSGVLQLELWDEEACTEVVRSIDDEDADEVTEALLGSCDWMD